LARQYATALLYHPCHVGKKNSATTIEPSGSIYLTFILRLPHGCVALGLQELEPVSPFHLERLYTKDSNLA